MKIIKSILIYTLIFLGTCVLYIISKILLSNALNEFLFVNLGLANVLVILFIFFKKCLKFLGNIHKNKELLKEKQ